jgi:hypothetical protein
MERLCLDHPHEALDTHVRVKLGALFRAHLTASLQSEKPVVVVSDLRRGVECDKSLRGWLTGKKAREFQLRRDHGWRGRV